MKKNSKYYISLTALLLALMLISSVGCYAQSDSLQKLAYSVVQKERIDTTADFYDAFSRLGKSIIPYLIEVIDKKQTGLLGYQDPLSSRIYPFIINNYVGIRAAYIIEHILANTEKDRLFNYCVILRVLREKPIMDSLTIEDMVAIKKIYMNWWQTNRLKPMEELSKDWSNNKRPLSNSIYVWK
ncbi:hypothetical protein [Deminuibacter soli]|uniref:Uncharacterized protein n=1 Tax=Deminuibacter soli TaxID=2291815 RepID=A0A3E1NEL2_9BACT|nr:hypothetical protein [Deminuibacter soli]RFM26423.1 hypothetical protein DXN05_19530 [Deminuibacter soli]